MRGILCADKKAGDQLFDTMDANDLNKRLKELMDGLSVKVWALGSGTLGPICGLRPGSFKGPWSRPLHIATPSADRKASLELKRGMCRAGPGDSSSQRLF